MIDDPVNDLATEMTHADCVAVGEGDGDFYIRLLPAAIGDKLIDLASDVLARLHDKRQQFSGNSFL